MHRAYFALGLVGFPLGHSLSPRLQTAALRAAGLPGTYRLYPVAPSAQGLEELQRLLEQVRRGELQGLNVTIPHKQRLLPFLDRLSPTALQVGAVNTIYCQDGRLVGENTDVSGFTADLVKHLSMPGGEELRKDGSICSRRQAPDEALVFGAGGSARAIICALGRFGWKVTVAARRLEQSEEVAEWFSKQGIQVKALRLSQPDLAEYVCRHTIRLMVNATPLGMGSLGELSPWFEGLAFPQKTLVYDLVYNPAETPFLRQARAAGLLGVNGLGMLLEQAALSFACWTGIRPPLEILHRALQEEKHVEAH